MTKNKNNILIVVSILSLISIAIALSGCMGEVGPESVVINSVKYLDNGQYEKLMDMYVNPETLQPYKPEEKTKSAEGLKTLLGANGENIEIQDFQVVNKEKIDEETYKITTRLKYKMTIMGRTETKDENETKTVVKVNGEWKIADKLPAPGFSTLLGIIGLIGSVYIIRRHKKLEK